MAGLEPNELVAVASTPSMRLASWQHIMFACWIDAPDVVSVRQMAEAIQAFSQRMPRFAGFNFVSAQKASRLDEETRKLVTEIRAKHGAKQLAIATVIEGEGFRAAAVRAVASGLNLLSRESFPSKNFDSLDDAAPWFTSVTQVDPIAFMAVAKRFREGT